MAESGGVGGADWADWGAKGNDGKDTDLVSNVERLEQLGEFFLVGEVTEKRCADLSMAMLRRAKEAVEGGKPLTITLHINSQGGSAHAGFALGASIMTIRGKGIPVRTHIMGEAHSMGLIIAQFGQRRDMDALATAHIHDISYYCYGNTHHQDDSRDHVDHLRTYAAGVFAARNTKRGVRSNPDWWKETYFNGRDHFFSALEALEEGLIDVVSGGYPIA